MDWFFSLLCAAVNFDFILILINLVSILCNSIFFKFYTVLQLITMFYSSGGARTFDMCY